MRTALDHLGNELVDLDGSPVPVNRDGTITLYHHTSPEIAERILRTGRFVSAMNTAEVYFSNRRDSEYAAAFGDGEVVAQIPTRFVELNDAFHGGEIHVSVPKAKITPAMIVLATARLSEGGRARTKPRTTGNPRKDLKIEQRRRSQDARTQPRTRGGRFA